MRFSCLFYLTLVWATFGLNAAPVYGQERSSWNQDFEQVSGAGHIDNWFVMPDDCAIADNTQQTGGSWSARLTRDASSADKFSGLMQQLPVDFSGKKITLRGNLQVSKVKGSASIWMRQDGPSGSIEFKNLGRKSLKGTHDWKSYEISFPLKDEAVAFVFGVTLAGVGTLWVDDMEILVDGVPIKDVPFKEIPKTILDTDQEFTNGSGVEFGPLSPEGVDRLVLLGKVWGFLKYHHPAITNGKHHWDYDLFRFLPDYLALTDQAAVQAALVQWVDSLGAIPPCKPCSSDKGNWQMKGDLRWIDDENLLGSDLCKRLQWVYKNRHAEGAQFFVSLNPGPQNPIFDMELAYEHLDFPDAGYRLLALYRLGSIIAYWSPYRDIIGEDWDDVQREFIPRILAVTSMVSYRMELLALVARENDSHANLFSSYGLVPPVGDLHPPFAIRFIDNEAVVFRIFPEFPTGKTDLEVGDVIETIDGQPVQKMVEELAEFYGASNQTVRLRSMARKFLYSNTPLCRLKVRRAGKSHDVTIKRQPITYKELVGQSRHDRPGSTFQLLSPEVAYLKMDGLKRSQVSAYVKQAEGTKGWILDLRGYPPEMFLYPMGGHLVTETTDFTRITKCDFANPGFFSWEGPFVLGPKEPTYKGKIVILVDETTQSRAEYHALAFRATPHAVVMGSTTAGADGTVSKIVFPGGDWCYLTGRGIFNPDFSPTQRVGIVPDIEIMPTIEGVRQGRDEVLEAAVSFVVHGIISADEKGR